MLPGGHRGSGFGPVAVTRRCGTQSSTWTKPSNVAPSRTQASWIEIQTHGTGCWSPAPATGPTEASDTHSTSGRDASPLGGDRTVASNHIGCIRDQPAI